MELSSLITPSPRRCLALQADDGWDIPNSTDEDVTPGYIALARQSEKISIALATATSLGPPTGRYNCHGLVFASRRTNIPPQNMPQAVDIDALLRRDQYEQVVFPPQVGDIVVYRMGTEIMHTGFVSSVRRLSDQSAALIIFVWSMWGGMGEFEHHERACPYTDCAIEYWKVRR